MTQTVSCLRFLFDAFEGYNGLMHISKTSWSLIIAAVALALLLFSTDPEHIPSALLIVPFALLFIIFTIGATRLSRAIGRSRRTSLRLGVLFAGLPCLLLVLRSINQLTLKDALTVLVLFIVTYFYIVRSEVRPLR